MTVRKQVIAIAITYDDSEFDAPEDWSWDLMLKDELKITRQDGALIEATAVES